MSQAKVTRNMFIVKRRNEGWSFRKIAKQYGLYPSQVHEIYHRDKDRYGKRS